MSNKYLDIAIEKVVKQEVNAVLDKIRTEIEQLHYRGKLDFITNDEIVEMVFGIIDKYKAESEDNNE